MTCMLALLSPPAPTHGVTKQKQPSGPSEARLLPWCTTALGVVSGSQRNQQARLSLSFHPFLSPTCTLCYFNNPRRILNRLPVCRGKF